MDVMQVLGKHVRAQACYSVLGGAKTFIQAITSKVLAAKSKESAKMRLGGGRFP